ncbi:MAG: carbonate dehydratase [Planctomycetota bacterium]|nr:MAG: carbonate dehydratase [Planctomycetota bacterium]
MNEIDTLFRNNREWSERRRREDPEFFARLIAQQRPAYLWIGCSDSRVPANEIVGLLPGEMFVHRNVANVVVQTDLNCLSVLQYAIDVLQVRHVIVCGHYGCGGVAAALRGGRLGLIENWLRHVQHVALEHRELIDALDDEDKRSDRLCELNVLAQTANVCRTTVLQDAWARGQEVAVHGCVYRLADGILKRIAWRVRQPRDLEPALAAALGRIAASSLT